jgi:hypothetical protein
MSKKIRKVKNFTFDLTRACARDLINNNDKMCAIGQYLYRCGYSKDEIRLMNENETYLEVFQNLSNVDGDRIVRLNDDTKSSWERRIVKLTKVFSEAGINVKVKR